MSTTTLQSLQAARVGNQSQVFTDSQKRKCPNETCGVYNNSNNEKCKKCQHNFECYICCRSGQKCPELVKPCAGRCAPICIDCFVQTKKKNHTKCPVCRGPMKNYLKLSETEHWKLSKENEASIKQELKHKLEEQLADDHELAIREQLKEQNNMPSHIIYRNNAIVAMNNGNNPEQAFKIATQNSIQGQQRYNNWNNMSSNLIYPNNSIVAMNNSNNPEQAFKIATQNSIQDQQELHRFNRDLEAVKRESKKTYDDYQKKQQGQHHQSNLRDDNQDNIPPNNGNQDQINNDHALAITLHEEEIAPLLYSENNPSAENDIPAQREIIAIPFVPNVVEGDSIVDYQRFWQSATSVIGVVLLIVVSWTATWYSVVKR